jgi:mycothiol synthase
MARFEVSPAAAHELLPACRLLFSEGRAEHSRDRILGDSHTSGLFVARDASGRLHAAALVQALPGALGVAWAPRGDSAAAVDAVVSGACEWLRSRGVKVCQAFAGASEVADVAALECHGFRHTTQLVFMRRVLDSIMSVDEPVLSHEMSSLSVATFPQLLRTTLLATHEGTFDCPELNAARTSDELLAGFEAGTNSAFCLASADGRCVGAALFDFDVEERVAELSYIGVVPHARGRGVGGAVLAFMMGELIAAGCRTLNLSVDARNAPAMKLYTRHGFVEYDRREVWLATWPA